MLAEIPRKGPAPSPGAVEVPSESQPSARALVRVPMAGVDLGPIGPSAPESQISHSSLFEIRVSIGISFLLFLVSLGIAKEMHPGPGPSKLCFRNHSGQCAVIISTTMTGLTVSLMACFRKP